MKQYLIERWLLKHAHLGSKSITQAQLVQARARLFFACAGLLYLFLHAENFDHYLIPYLSLSACYFLITISSLFIIRHNPHSLTRWLLFPVLDMIVVSFGMLVDGGHTSGLYFMYLIIIFGNGFRFGNNMLLYSQALSLLGLLATSSYTYSVTKLGLDPALLFWQTGALIIIPLYVYLIGQRVENATRAQSEAEETSFHLLDKGPLPVFTYEIDQQNRSRILYTNAMINEIFHSEHEMLIGEPVDALTLIEDSNEMLDFCRQAYHQHGSGIENKPRSIYIRGKDKSGDIIKLAATAIRMRWQDRWVGVCFMHDITQREDLQEQLEAVHRRSYISTLVAGIVHDFRNVLTNMIGYAEVLHMTSNNETDKQHINEIIEAGERGSELITHLLKLSKNRENNSSNAYSKGELLHQPLNNIIGLARLQLPQNIQLICKIKEPLHDVAISTTEIEQILLNLINNSTQAINGAGIIGVEINTDSEHRLAKPGHPALCIKVIDNGEGIAEEDLDLVFKAFWTSNAEQGGSGLGLTMVQRIVKLHHGRITVESTPDERTCFTIHLPPHIEEKGSIGQQTISSTAVQTDKGRTTKPSSGCHILLVDDGPDILKIHQSMLTHLGHTSCTAESGKEALELFADKEISFDLIVTDFRMPGMNGLELVQEIRKQGSNIPILMVTAFGEDEQLQQVGKYQVTLINKPVSMEKFKQGLVDCQCRCP